jgi:hypothetical protein
MSTLRSEDRVSLCTFTFADGRRCRTPRHSGHPQLCYFHARKEAQALAAEQAGRDISVCLSSGRYLSACNLSIALGRLFSAVAQGHIKPKTAKTLAYLGQTLLQTIRLAQHEYINAFDTDAWRSAVRSSLPDLRGACPDPRGVSPEPPGAHPDLQGLYLDHQPVHPNRRGPYPALRVHPDLRGTAPRLLLLRVPRTPNPSRDRTRSLSPPQGSTRLFINSPTPHHRNRL